MGGYNALFIMFERFLSKYNTAKSAGREKYRHLINISGIIYTLVVINSGWILFRSSDIQSAVDYFRGMFLISSPERIDFTSGWYVNKWSVFCMMTGVLFATSLPQKIGRKAVKMWGELAVEVIKYVLLFLMFVFSVSQIISGTYNPFIYFQF